MSVAPQRLLRLPFLDPVPFCLLPKWSAHLSLFATAVASLFLSTTAIFIHLSLFPTEDSHNPHLPLSYHSGHRISPFPTTVDSESVYYNVSTFVLLLPQWSSHLSFCYPTVVSESVYYNVSRSVFLLPQWSPNLFVSYHSSPQWSPHLSLPSHNGFRIFLLFLPQRSLYLWSWHLSNFYQKMTLSYHSSCFLIFTFPSTLISMSVSMLISLLIS